MLVDVAWATIVLATVTAVLALITAYHAWQSRRLVGEMRKDRRRQFLESALRRAYSRLFEIFRRAMCRPDIGFNFSAVEMHEIRDIVERYGHYLDPQLLGKIRKTIVDNPAKLQWQPAELDPLYMEIMNKCQTLSKELQSLVIGA